MARLGFADRDDLARWGASQGAAADLPRLVRRLILETAPVVSLGFAAGIGVSGSGWDGTARTSAPTVKVPGGLSLWELSTRGDVNRKANSDYAKRTSTPDGTPTTHAAYVAVSTHTWQDRESWAQGKSGDGRWREVRGYGVDDLEAWLEDAPVTHAWISEMIGLQPHGLVTAESWWEGWSRATGPALPAKALLAGREKVTDALHNELAGPGSLITIAGASRDDVLAFLAAVAVSDAEQDGGALLARVACVEQPEAWRRWRDLKRPLVLAPLTDEVTTVMTAGAAGSAHHVVVPVIAGTSDLDLPPVDAQAAAAVLVEVGLDEERANEVGHLARLSLLAGRRRIAVKPELHRPDWARPPVARLARRMILLGRFSENAPADLEIVADALGAPYADAADEVAALAVGEDPLFVRLGASLGVVSPVDAWILVRDQLRKEDLEAFHTAAVRVLTESDPRHELAPEERWQAGMLGKQRRYSSDLRHGLATTLALMGAYEAAPVAGARLTPAEWAGWVVRQVLEAANRDETARLWASLDDVVRLLAEAAPDEFLAAVRAGLAGDEPLLAKLLTDRRDVSTLFGTSSHSGLLWGLEICSWSRDHFGAVVDLLARWAEVDPGGSYANRPRATLVDFFRAWFPQTSVNAERRLAVLDGLRARHSAVAWDVLLELLPELHSTATHIAAPRFRDWKQPDLPKTHGEVARFYEAIVARALEDADAHPDRLAPLVDRLPTLPPTGRDALYARLEHVAAAIDEEARTKLWALMRAEAAKNREFATADWAMTEPDVARLEQIAGRFEPQMATARLRWLFEDHLPSLPGVDHSDGLGDYRPAIAKARADAAAAIAGELDWEGLYAFGCSLPLVWFFGPALAEAGVHQYEDRLLALLDSNDDVDLNLAASYFGKRFRDEGWEWLDALLARDLSPRQRARLLLATDDGATWGRLDDDEVGRAFWTEFRIVGLGPDFPHVETVARALFGVGRYGAGLDLVNLYLRDDSDGGWAPLVADGLEALLVHGDDGEVRHLSEYGLRNLFSYLERVPLGEERLARLEWAYLPAFEFEPAPPTLSRYLAANPSFFVDVVSLVFRPGDEDDGEMGDSDRSKLNADDDQDGHGDGKSEPDKRTVDIARNAYRLLSEWRTLPGRGDDDTVDSDVLGTWVAEARERLRETRRLRVGDNYIGKLFASSPPDPDGEWPCLAVRELLERVQSHEIEDGMRVEIFNSLGVTSRGVLDGGDQERDKSATYREQAQRFVDRWPQTAAILRDVAESFERLARDHDEDAERRRTGFDE